LSVKSRAIHVPEQGENHEHQAIAKKQGTGYRQQNGSWLPKVKLPPKQ
jgi:hypothetical protein